MNTVVVNYDSQVKQALSQALFLESDDEFTLKSCISPDDTGAFVIGPNTENPLAIAQRMARVDKQLAVLIVPKQEAEQQLRQQRLMTPSLGSDVRILEHMDSPQLKEAVEQASNRTLARRRHSKITTKISPVLEVWRPNKGVLLDTLLEQLPIGLAVLDPSNRIELWNQHLEKITGITSAQAKQYNGQNESYTGKNKVLLQFIEEFTNSDDQDREFCFEEHETGSDNKHFLVSQTRLLGSSGQPGSSGQQGSLLMIRDISESVRAEKQRINAERNHADSQRLESLGLLAGGIAHDFNNILMAILGNAELGQILPSDSDKIETILEDIIFATHRASELTRQMLAYVGKASFEIKTHGLNSIVNDTHDLLRASINKKSELKLSLYPGELYVDLDLVQMGQVLMNLIINASEAIGNVQGTISVSTKIEVFEKEHKAINSDILLPAGDYAIINVQDSGSGMSQKTQQKIFEPFYTTKTTGHGLGLSAVIGIVKAHSGELKVSSELGVGTRFTVCLPLSSSHGELAQEDVTRGRLKPPPGGTRVLVIDDEDIVRSMAKQLLRSLGYEIELAENGKAGLSKIASGLKFDLILLDSNMPGLSGEDFMRELQSQEIEIPIILCSGYTTIDPQVCSQFENLHSFLPKPYTRYDLEKALFKVIYPDELF